MNVDKAYTCPQGAGLAFKLILVFFALITGLSITCRYELLAIEVGLAFILIALIIFTRDFTPVLLMLIVLRPIVDIWTEYRIGFVGIQMVMTVGIITSILLYLVTDKNRYRKKQIFQDPLVFLLTVYILLNFVSFGLNPKVDVNASLSLIFRFVSFLGMYVWGMVLFKSHHKRDWIIAAYIVASVIIAVAGYYQLATGAFYGIGTYKDRGVNAIQGTFFHPNMYANFLVLANLSCIYFILNKKYMKLNYIILIANLFLFSQTYSRIALAVWLLMIFVLALAYRKRSVYYLSIVIMAAAIIFYKFPSIIDFWAHRLETIDDPHALMSNRSYIFTALIHHFKMNPLIGIGPSTFWPYYFPYAQPHNELLRNLAEVGLLGTIPFVLMWTIIIKRFFSFRYCFQGAVYDKQKFIILLMIFAVATISLTSNIGTNVDLMWPLFLLFGGYASPAKNNPE